MQNDAYTELGGRKANSVIDNRLATVKVKPRSDQACSLFSLSSLFSEKKNSLLFFPSRYTSLTMSGGRWSLPGSSLFPDPLEHVCRSNWSLWLGLNFLFSGLKEHARERTASLPQSEGPRRLLTLLFSKLGGQSQASGSSWAAWTSAPSASESPTSLSAQTSVHVPPPRREAKGSELAQQRPLPSSTSRPRSPAPPRAHPSSAEGRARAAPPPPVPPPPPLPAPQPRGELRQEMSSSAPAAERAAPAGRRCRCLQVSEADFTPAPTHSVKTWRT